MVLKLEAEESVSLACQRTHLFAEAMKTLEMARIHPLLEVIFEGVLASAHGNTSPCSPSKSRRTMACTPLF